MKKKPYGHFVTLAVLVVVGYLVVVVVNVVVVCLFEVHAKEHAIKLSKIKILIF